MHTVSVITIISLTRRTILAMMAVILVTIVIEMIFW